VRIVDAKFAMPKSKAEGEAGVDHEFVCLDMPEYPAEHDDITIIFDTEDGELSCSLHFRIANSSQHDKCLQKHYQRQQRLRHEWDRFEDN
jgi:hypothetical protein